MITPKYVFRKTLVTENYESILKNLPNTQIFYAVKCNASCIILQVLHELGSGFEIASKPELEKLRSIGVPSSKIICGLPIKPPELIDYLVQHSINYFVFDNMREYEKLRVLALNAKKILRLYVKDIGKHCIEYGMKINEVLSNIELLKEADGLSFHISDNKDSHIMMQALDRVELVLQQFTTIKDNFILNIGGGFDLGDCHVPFYTQLNSRLAKLTSRYPCMVYAEPGSVLVNTAGKLISKVILTKSNDGLTDVYIDAGIPSGMLKAPGYIKVISNDIQLEKRRYYRFMDITSLHRPLFQCKLNCLIEENDIVEFGNYGAYTLCYRNDFHCWENPSEELCD